MQPHRCYGCMSMTEQEVCEKCGYPAARNNEPHQLPVGTVLRGQYTVGRVLGQGGFGITYLGWDEYLDTPVAIKEYYPNFLVNRESSLSRNVHCFTEAALPQYEKSKARFLREAKALAKFQEEPAIVRIRSFFEEYGTAYIVMEYVRGTDLAKYVQNRGGKLSAAETLRILKPVMEALEAVHQAGLVHRDISPDNVMLHPRGGAKLLDFGAARELEDGSGGRSTETIVKHGFAPIEQYQTHGKLGPWTDVYAMCATVWYCLTGSIPEEAITRLTDPTPMEWDKIPGLTERQCRTLEKGMAVQMRDRLSSVRELIDGLYSEEPQPAPDREALRDELRRELEPEVRQQLEKELRPRIEAELRPKIEAELRPRAETESHPKPETELHSQSSWTEVQADKAVGQKPEGGRKKLSAKQLTCLLLTVVVLLGGLWLLVRPNGWRQEGRYYYYYNWLGDRLENSWNHVDGYYYYFGSDGRMLTDLQKVDGYIYYFGENDGRMRTGWQTIGGSIYYFGESDGRMRTGRQVIDGRVYDFGTDGKLK